MQNDCLQKPLSILVMTTVRTCFMWIFKLFTRRTGGEVGHTNFFCPTPNIAATSSMFLFWNWHNGNFNLNLGLDARMD